MLESIAFIPDGNRRFAKKSGISMLEAYRLGTHKAWETLDWIAKYPSIKTGTFYTLSLKNFERNRHELSLLFKVFEKELDKVLQTGYFERNGIRLNFIGRLDVFPEKVRNKMLEAQEFTAQGSKRLVNLALGYDGQAEIVDAARCIARDYAEKKVNLEAIDVKSFQDYLYSSFPNPDLIIRTSGTQRLSGFLTYQSSYSELYFSDKYWPEFSEQDLGLAIEEFNARQRKYGK